MATFHAEDRVGGMSTDIGTGNLTLSGQVPGNYLPFSPTYGVGDTFDALIVTPDNTGWEVSLCTLVSTTVLGRLKVWANSASNSSFINFNNSNKTILVVQPAVRLRGSYQLVGQDTITPGVTDIYVDTASGVDGPGQGLSAGTGAYKTIQYAVNQLPRVLFNNVTVHIAAGIYREQVTVQGFSFAGPYSLTFQGANGSDILASTSGATWANGAGNGQVGWTTITKAGAGWSVNAFAGKLLTITSGTGAGQTFIVQNNTTTTINLHARVGSSYLGGTLGDTTSAFHVYNWGTRVTGSNAAADATPVRNYCFQITGIIGTSTGGVFLNNLQLDYAALSCVDVVRSAVDLTQCWVAASAHYGVHYNILSSAANGITLCTFQSNHDFDILVEGGSVFAQITRTRIISAAVRCLQVTGMSAINYGVIENYFNTTGGYQVYIADGASIKIGDYNNIDGTGAPAGSHGVVIDTGARVNFSMFVNATTTVSNCGGWGLLSLNGGQGANVAAQVSSWSSNVSGNYTPTTALVGGNS